MLAVICFENVRFWCLSESRRSSSALAMRSIGEVPPHERTGHQNWPASYAECRANVVQMRVENLQRPKVTLVAFHESTNALIDLKDVITQSLVAKQ